MTTVTPTAREEGSRNNASGFVGISLALLPVLVVLRVYEYVVVRSAHILPAGAPAAMLAGFRSDVALVLWLALALAIPILLLANWRPDTAMHVHRGALVLVVLATVALLQYFAVTFVPLGADLFGYSLKDISETTMSSKGIGVLALVPFALFGALTWYLTGRARHLHLSKRVSTGFFAVAGITLAVPSILTVTPRNYSTDAAFFLADNTTVYFSTQALRHFAPRWFSASHAPGPEMQGFLLLHPARDDDVLGPFLNIGTQKPNIVFVIVEGLGRDFVGEGARYGGFTPFLDSLANRSLYWENFLSTSGRTFGILPALLGSLPQAEGGFMELGSHMPRHVSLVSLLKERGYATSYFTGADGHYDMIDLFMERQGVDSFIDASKFGSRYEKQPAGEGGFSWGYGDQELFRRSLASLDARSTRPRLDVYLTITTHEPFIPPRAPEYAVRFERRLATLPVDTSRRAEYRKYSGVFETLLYLDDAVRSFLEEYAKREDYRRTIFIITGDHRLIPIPPATRIDRYRVPFIVYSPMVKAAVRFSSVSSHLDVTPSLIALLHKNVGMTFPGTVPWLGTGIDTSRAFRNVHSLVLMRTKNQTDEYLDGLHFLSGEQLFTVQPGLDLAANQDGAVLEQLREKLERARRLSLFVMTEDRIYPRNASDSADARIAKRQESAFDSLELSDRTTDELFRIARSKAVAGDYDHARVIALRLLRDSPNNHDARALLGRTYAWQRRFAEARPILTELIRRAPDYVDGYVALIDVEIWSGHRDDALARVNDALGRFPGNKELIAEKARVLNLIA